MLTAQSRYLFSTCRLDVVDVAYIEITWSYGWGISVGRIGTERGHRRMALNICIVCCIYIYLMSHLNGTHIVAIAPRLELNSHPQVSAQHALCARPLVIPKRACT